MPTSIVPPVASERTIRLKYHADRVPYGDNRSDMYSLDDNTPRFTLDGVTWKATVGRRESLNLYLVPIPSTVVSSIECGVRLIDRDQRAVMVVPAQTVDSTNLSSTTLIKWDMLVTQFCVDGEFTIEFFFPTPIVHRATSMTLESTPFKDIVVACGEDDNGVECNKCIVARESQVMRAAFENKTSKESLENKFVIGHDCATPENVRLFVRAMYEGYIAEVMVSHAGELLQLAHMYDCPTLFVQVVESLKQLLTHATFWSTVKLATLLDEGGRELLVACAKYAKEPKILYDLLKRGDHSAENVQALMMEIAQFDST